MADFIYIDGVEYKADKELVDLIKNRANNNCLSNSFERKAKGDCYYFLGSNDRVHKATELGTWLDDKLYEIGNYCTNEDLLKKRAAEETLLRKMWRFSLTHDGDKIDWNNQNTQKWYLSFTLEDIAIFYACLVRQAGVVYFNSKEIAEEAKKEFEKELKEVYENC